MLKEKNVLPEDLGLSSKNLAYIDDVMKRAIDEKVLKGMVTLVARYGKIAQFKAYGEADEGVPMDTDCIFRLASMSKGIGTAALLQLFGQGKVMPSDPVSNYIPAYKDAKVAVQNDQGEIELVPAEREITVHDLLTMTAGLSSTGAAGCGHPGAEYVAARLKEAGIVDTMHPVDMTIGEAVDIVSKLPLAAQPGERWDYSNMSMLTVGHIVEIVSGMPLDEYLKKNIFDPLEMKDTAFFPDRSKWERMPSVFESGTMRKLTHLDVPGTDDTQLPFSDCKKFHNVAGGLMGTAYDYFRFAQMLANEGELDGQRILSPNAVQLMTQNHIGDMRDAFYGHAWGYMMNVEVDYNTTFNYMGLGSYSWHGYWGTVYNVWPEKDMVAIFLTQVSPEVPSWKIQERFLNTVANSIIE